MKRHIAGRVGAGPARGANPAGEGCSSRSTLGAYDLRTENRAQPLGIDTDQPRFSWRLRSAAPGQAQSAYRTDGHATDQPVWSTGWVTDARVYGIAYDGPLQPRTRYTWTLQLRDVAGEETELVTSWFETGLYSVRHGATTIWERWDGWTSTTVPVGGDELV